MSSDAHYWNQRYRHGSTPWDTGIAPPELEAFWSERRAEFGPQDVVLDLGCGTLTNLRFLARQAVKALGVDMAFSALRQGRHRLFQMRDVGHRADILVGDVTRLPLAQNLAAYALDLGCLHTLDVSARPAYVEELCRIIRPSGYYHLFAFQRVSEQAPSEEERRFFLPGEIDALFQERFETLSEAVDAEATEGRVGVWRLMRRA